MQEENLKNVKHNTVFTIYFTTMFCLYTNTYIQLIAQLGIIAYVVLPILNSFRITKQKQKNIAFYFGWFGLLTLSLYASKYWAYDVYAGSRTMITVFRIFVIGLIIFYWTNSKQKALSILYSFTIGCAVMGVVAIITSASAIGTTSFGEVIGQHRNQIGAVAAPLTIVCYFLKKEFRMGYGNALSVYFAILTLCTGSRSSILQIIVIMLLIVLFAEVNISKKIYELSMMLFCGFIAIIIAQNIPYFNTVIWSRIDAAIKTVLGIDIADTSALGRDYYKTIAFNMFLKRPFLGYGLDGFVCFVRDNPYIMDPTSRLAPVYAHCNYAELAADLGLLGLAIWYIPIIKQVVKVIQIRKKTLWGGCLFGVFVSMILFDYSRIPWETHLIMYLFFIIILLINFEYKNYKIDNT